MDLSICEKKKILPAFLPKPLLRAKSEISPKTKVEENGNPYPQNFVSIFRVHFRINTLVERSKIIRENYKRRA